MTPVGWQKRSDLIGDQVPAAFQVGATAAHCVDAGNLASVRFVFGYEMRDAATALTRISTGEIYRGIRIIGREIGSNGTDWAVVQLDRPVVNHPFVRVRRTGQVPDSAGVHVIGHPSGLPKKHAGNAAVRDNASARFFVANLDTYGGNSGSPVFNSTTHEVEGVLVRGETDYVSNGSCTVSNVCPVDGCQGEDCTRTTEFASLVPESRLDCIPFDLGQARVEQIGGRWKITVGPMWLLDFGASQVEADQALRVLNHYGMNAQCFVGRPQPSMEFYLVNGQAPQGAMAGEDAIPFDPGQLEVQKVRGRWKIVEGSHWIMDFDQEEGEARQALSHILRFGFTHICFVGRPDPSMTYFRR
jgi:Trypsin-like peptidase domain